MVWLRGLHFPFSPLKYASLARSRPFNLISFNALIVTTDIELNLPATLESTTYTWVEPGASGRIKGFSYFEVLIVALVNTYEAKVEAALVIPGLYTFFDEDAC